jgi:hypothetical protein
MRKIIGIVFGPFEEVTQNILSYLLIYQNTLQQSFEFRILACPPDDPFLQLLARDPPPGHLDAEKKIDDFLSRVRSWNDEEAESYELDPVCADRIVLLSNTVFSDNYYYVGSRSGGVMALGGWEDAYAPPSIVEYYLTFVVATALGTLASFRRHFETRGCIFDFNGGLSEARFSVLTGYICDSCQSLIRTQSSNQVLEDARILLSRDWLGDSSAPSDVAVTVKKLGYDLFRTAGIKPTWKEKWVAALEQEGLKNVLSLTFQILLAIALLVLGLKKS